jgi:glycosyltransferase involved in cell wall biosynthesis
MSTPLVSIITPSFNSGDYLDQAIESVINQKYPNLEHLIIDGGSTDNTLDILRQHASHVTWVSEPDDGQADALNKGFQRAKGEVIGWLNADDSYQPNAIQQAVRYLQQQPEISLVYGHFNFIDQHNRITYTHKVAKFSKEGLLYGNIIPNAGMFFRRQIIEELGGVNPQLHYVMDWEFVLRVALRYRIRQVPAVWGNFRIVAGTKSVEHTDRFWPEIIPVLDEISNQVADFKSHRQRALFFAHLLGAIEFARHDRLSQTKAYWETALSFQNPSQTKINHLAFAIAETATRPWHTGFRQYPEATLTIERFINCLGSSSFEQQLINKLNIYHEVLVYPSITQNLRAIKELGGSVIRFIFYNSIGNRSTLAIRRLKNQLMITLPDTPAPTESTRRF